MMTTADRLVHSHLNLLKSVWQADQRELEIQSNFITQLREELANACSDTELQTIRCDMGILFSSDTKNPRSFVRSVEKLVPEQCLSGLELKCCIRSGQSWITVGSGSTFHRLTDVAFDSAVSIMVTDNVYHLKQLVTYSHGEAILSSYDDVGVFVVPVLSLACFWLIERETTKSKSVHDDQNSDTIYNTYAKNKSYKDIPQKGTDRSVTDVEDDVAQLYRAAIFLRSRYFSVLETASWYCMSSLVQSLESQKLQDMVRFVH
jgi:hypothetical protein